MIFITEREAPLTAPTFMESLGRGIPRAYAILFFSSNVRFGWWLLAVGMLQPSLGLCGLFGVVVAAALAWWLGYDRALLRTGFSLFNPMLTCLTVGWLHHCHQFNAPVLALLLIVAAVGGFFLSTGMHAWVGWHFGISAHSLPSVVGAYGLYLMAHSLYGPPLPPPQATVVWLDMPFLPPLWQGLFQAFGSMAFQARALPGVLVFVGLAWTSPLSALVATGAYATGVAVLVVLGVPPELAGATMGGYNFVLIGIELGASYFITSGPSLLLASLGCVVCACTGLALGAALPYFALPPSALPYNLVLLMLIYALHLRGTAGALVPSPAPGAMPEEAARQVRLQALRFPDLAKPALSLPFDAPRIVTQGFAGPLTHRGRWQHALDFEAEVRATRHRSSGESLEDFHLFGTAVLAPCSGYVAYVDNQVADNAPGQNNPDQKWGNCVILYSDAGYYVMLAHLKQGSVKVEPGQRVLKGEELAQCGNSGRSPVPHLHLQIQPTGYFGAPTLPFCLKHFIETGPDGGSVFRTSGVPDAMVTVRPATPNAALAEVLGGLLPGQYRYRLTDHTQRTWEETVELTFDEWGRFRFRSRRHGAQFVAFFSDGVFYTNEFQGPGDSVLAFIAAGLARIPCIADAEVSWFDCVSSVPFHSRATRWLLGLAEPFFGPFLLRCRYVLKLEHGGGFAIHAVDTGHGDGAT
ncbi:MAG: urea transporter, partial [Roseimicrobium sp.]